jgi:3-isopropylmalate dehydrogenase
VASSKLIAIIGGDGIGPEVVAQGVRVLEYYRERRSLPIELWHLDLGADRYLRDGATFPDAIRHRIAAEASAVLLGALGDPRIPKLEHARDILFGMRFGLDLYANIRPVRALADRLVPLRDRTAADVDFVVFRENTEGAYSGMGGQFKRGTRDEVAICEDVNTRKGVERLVRAGFEHARRGGHRRIHLADKSNAMPQAHELWHRVFFEVASEYPEVEARHMYVDAMCLHLVREPAQFEVIVTSNLFGDILTDLGAALQGGLGMAASANVHPALTRCCDEPHPPHGRPGVGLFEPVHGSAPPLAGKDSANPMACVLTVGMLMAHLGYPDEERRLEAIVARAIAERRCTPDVGGTLGTRAVGDWLLSDLAASFV